MAVRTAHQRRELLAQGAEAEAWAAHLDLPVIVGVSAGQCAYAQITRRNTLLGAIAATHDPIQLLHRWVAAQPLVEWTAARDILDGYGPIRAYWSTRVPTQAPCHPDACLAIESALPCIGIAVPPYPRPAWALARSRWDPADDYWLRAEAPPVWAQARHRWDPADEAVWAQVRDAWWDTVRAVCAAETAHLEESETVLDGLRVRIQAVPPPPPPPDPAGENARVAEAEGLARVGAWWRAVPPELIEVLETCYVRGERERGLDTQRWAPAWVVEIASGPGTPAERRARIVARVDQGDDSFDGDLS